MISARESARIHLELKLLAVAVTEALRCCVRHDHEHRILIAGRFLQPLASE